MGNTSSKPHHHASSHLPSSKSRHQPPQYNPDNESSSQVGQASSEHFDAVGLGKWNTETSDETGGARPEPYEAKEANKKRSASKKSKNNTSNHKNKPSVVKEVYTVRETVGNARASCEAVCGSPEVEPGNKELENRYDEIALDDEGETWATVNEPYYAIELKGIGGWAKPDEPLRKKQRRHK